MDDEYSIRAVIREMLKTRGFQCVEAGDGSSAVTQYQEALIGGKPFDLVFVDLLIPDGMGGIDTCTQIRQIDPTSKVVLISGAVTDSILTDTIKDTFFAILQKPFLLRDVIGVIERLGD